MEAPLSYEGQRKAEDIVQYVSRLLDNPSRLVDKTQLISLLADIKVPTTVFFGNSEEELQVYFNVARSVENVEFVHATDDDTLRHFNK